MHGTARVAHRECAIQNVVGSVGHQKGICSCFGHQDVSEDGLTRREAAKRAYAYWNAHQHESNVSPSDP